MLRPRRLAALALAAAFAAPPALAAGPDQIYVGYSIEQPIGRNETAEIRFEYLVLFPDGLALRDIPNGGLDYANLERFAQKHSNRLGRYTRTSSQMTIEWGRSSRRGQVWKLTAEAGGWKLGANTKFLPAARVPRDHLKGIWQQASSGGRSNTASVSVGGEFIFRSNGDYERGSGDSKRGTYELDGYMLVLRARDGTEAHYTLYRWPWIPGAIAIETRVYQLLQSRRERRP
jgi:hypothetical protein